MTAIDAHVHLWDPGLHDHAWLRSAGELHRPFLLDDLTAAAGTVTAVVVQAGRTVDEARWLLDLAARSAQLMRRRRPRGSRRSGRCGHDRRAPCGGREFGAGRGP